MNYEVTISADDAIVALRFIDKYLHQGGTGFDALRLIDEYLHQGGTGFDAAALKRVADALGSADRIVIQPTGEETNA